MITVLMYHAVPDDAADDRGADPHYSVSKAQFARHLALFQAAGRVPQSVRHWLDAGVTAPLAGLAMTFDDGHVTNYEAAARLREIGGSADFFVNPSTIGTDHFLSWEQLREMDTWGMSIQSHAQHHHLLNDLTPAQVRSELGDSRRAIEDGLGRRCSLFAPPGGRVVPGLTRIAEELGYERVCSSRVDLWRERLLGVACDAAGDVPRLAVLQGTADARIDRWVRQTPWEIGLQRSRYQALGAAKRLLGNGVYQRLRGAALSRPAA